MSEKCAIRSLDDLEGNVVGERRLPPECVRCAIKATRDVLSTIIDFDLQAASGGEADPDEAEIWRSVWMEMPGHDSSGRRARVDYGFDIDGQLYRPDSVVKQTDVYFECGAD